jgi:hypothetical protein
MPRRDTLAEDRKEGGLTAGCYFFRKPFNLRERVG